MNKPKTATSNSNFLHIVLFSTGEKRLRAGWRLAIHTILLLVLTLLSGIAIFIPIGLLKIDFNSPLAVLANQSALLISITLTTFLSRHFLDKRSLTSLGLKPGFQALIDVMAGIIITFFQMGLIFWVELSQGWLKFEGFAWKTQSKTEIAAGLGLWLLIFILVGWQEELLSRGYHLQTITSGSNLFWGVLISSSVFGILHIFNYGATVNSTLGIFMAGLFLALPYILTKQLWLSIGLHIGWNFFEGVVFGFSVSGVKTFRLLQHTVNGPEIWTGGVFGPEAGLIVIPSLLLGSLLVFAYTRLKIHKPDLN